MLLQEMEYFYALEVKVVMQVVKVSIRVSR